jgi:diguanylate cyclase (GGDEF)-like protein
MSVRQAADVMSHSGLARIPVVEEGRLIGVVTGGDLLPELGRSFDPLTGLPWVDSLREWAITQLQRGNEITILFIDLDNFGQFNKAFGHIVGDEVLQAVTAALTALMDPDIDLLCRFGGDEFCIATLRTAAESEELSARIVKRVAEIRLPSIEGQIVTCTTGQHGGKRTKEREHIHYAATLNSLINLASRDCTARKSTPDRSIPAMALVGASYVPPTPRVRLTRVDVEWEGKTAHVHVNLQLGEKDLSREVPEEPPSEDLTNFPASAAEKTDEEGVLRLVAQTTARAARGILPKGYDIILTDVFCNTTSGGQTLITVVGEWITGTQRIPLAGSALATDNLPRGAASAVLAAINRPLGLVLSRH